MQARVAGFGRQQPVRFLAPVRDACSSGRRCLAPVADASTVPHDALPEALDLDSMDVFNLVIALSQPFAINILDAEVPHFTTFAGGPLISAKRVAAP